ncbi:hypothetical protein GLGCALEP_05025 [Pseudomonas sp. MM221]|nr:hypothetical protein GLGCALEP_05025 [Pseudomonas sp. MM221]
MPISDAVWTTINSDLHAVAVLIHNGCHIHALSLMYSSIDKMAWLSSASIDHGRKEFMAWVDDYFAGLRLAACCCRHLRSTLRISPCWNGRVEALPRQ